MPKLNVQQTNQNVIQAFKNALAIGNLKGIIASDGNHNFSTAGSNRNLLDNPWFTVNQREATSGGNGTYPADRWGVSYGTGGVTWSRNDDGSIAVSPNNLTSHGDLTQKIAPEVFPFLANRTVTASVMLADGTIYSGSTVVSTSTTKTPVYIEIDDKILQVNIYTNGTFSIQSRRGTLSIKAAKLELGSVSTLANDVPPDYWQELDKCLYYFERIKGSSGYHAYGIGVAETATQTSIIVPMHPKRTTSFTMSTSGAFALYNGGLKTATLSLGSSRASNTLIVTATSSGLTAGGCYQLITNSSADAYIDISADL